MIVMTTNNSTSVNPAKLGMDGGTFLIGLDRHFADAPA